MDIQKGDHKILSLINFKDDKIIVIDYSLFKSNKVKNTYKLSLKTKIKKIIIQLLSGDNL